MGTSKMKVLSTAVFSGRRLSIDNKLFADSRGTDSGCFSSDCPLVLPTRRASGDTSFPTRLVDSSWADGT